MAVDPLVHYSGSAQRYDELLDADGAVRPHWASFIEQLGSSGADAVRRSVELARRLVIENGVTYNVHADPDGRDRPWLLDPLPLLLSAEDWSAIEAGVIQRAELLNALLRDLYGEQKLLSSGAIPAELAFGHPNFLWPVHGLKPVGDVWLHLLAVDLARAPDGKWWVLGDRTQTPAGPGFVLENRQVVSRVLPRLIDDLGARPIEGFFNAMRGSLIDTGQDDPPLAVVLTPGPTNDTYFEHAYLARRLGLALVQGQDLTVRASTVYLKTFAGLRRVHAIFRRLEDDYCDPLELRPDSTLGVPGLLSAVRAGRVSVANAIGSGVLESPAWLGFLPAAARELLGARLKLPSVASWWCGEAPALKYVEENLDVLVIKGAFPNQRYEPTFGRHLDRTSRLALIERLRARPYAYVAQERLLLSHAPVWRSGTALRLAPRPMSLRVYALWTPQGYRVMPGGLARIAAEGVSDLIAKQSGGGSKDVWVLSATQEPVSGDEVSVPPRQVRHAELPSQLIENLYWLGRYSERCENKARLLRATLAARTNRTVWSVALEHCMHLGVLSRDRDPGVGVYDEKLKYGLASDLGRFSWSATQARSRLSAAHWRSISLMQRQHHEAGKSQSEPVETLDRLLVSLTALSGFALDDMTQDDGWRMLMLGRRLERVHFLSELFRRMLSSGFSPLPGTLDWLLDVSSSSITYRTRYVSAPQLGAVIQLLVFDDTNPRALAFQWQKIRRTLADLAHSLHQSPDRQFDEPVAALLAAAKQNIDGAQDQAVAARKQLAELLSALTSAGERVSERLSLRHFSHIEQDVRSVAT